MILQNIKGLFSGKDIVVCGTGQSFFDFEGIIPRYWTIACNKANMYIDPTFALCHEGPDDDIWQHIRNPLAVFCDHREAHRRSIIIPRNWQFYLTDREDCYGQMSTWSAAAVAGYLGARKIALIGVDFRGHPKFGNLSRLEYYSSSWYRLAEVLEKRGQQLLQLSNQSLLELTKTTWSEIAFKSITFGAN